MKVSRIWTGIIEANFANRRQSELKSQALKKLWEKKKISLSPVKENVKSEIS